MALDDSRRKLDPAEADSRNTTGYPGLQGFTHPEDRITSRKRLPTLMGFPTSSAG
jgi:hypothetical protein